MVLQKANLKTFLSFFLVAAMLVTSVVIYGIRPSAEAAELPEGYVYFNGSFEDNNYGDYYFDYWTYSATLIRIDEDEDVAKDGTHSVRIVARGAQSTSIYTSGNMPVQPNTDYTLTGWVYKYGEGGIGELEMGGQTVAATKVGEWEQLTLTWNSGSSDSTKIYCRARGDVEPETDPEEREYAGGLDADVRFDLVTLTKAVPGGDNEVIDINGSFEHYEKVLLKPGGWSGIGGGTKMLTSNLCVDGQYSMMFDGVTSPVYISYTVPVQPQTTYILSGYVYQPFDGSGQNYIDMNDIANEVQMIASAKEDWEYMEGLWYSDDRTSVTIRCVAGGNCYFDKIEFCEADKQVTSSEEPDSSQDDSSDDSSDTSSTTPEYTLGDVDQDGDVTATDALNVLKYSVDLIELSDEALLAAEVDGNDGVTASDALAILKKFVGLIEKFPVEEQFPY